MRGRAEPANPGDESLAETIRKHIPHPENGRYLRSLPAFAVSAEVPGELLKLLEKLETGE